MASSLSHTLWTTDLFGLIQGVPTIAQGLGRADADSAKSVLMDPKSTSFRAKESWRKGRWTAAGRKNFGKSWELFGRLELSVWT